MQPSPKAYLAEAKHARSRGFAVDIDNLIRDVTSVAAAVRDSSGRVRLVVSVHDFQGTSTYRHSLIELHHSR
ncbi:MAG: IclR family transcriptional regulator domain-containing protein [Xanthobacteraceae bacterium]